MASTYPAITELYSETLDRIGADADEWKSFLRFSASNYKLPFHEQVLVYAQRPDASAVLTYEGWRKHFGRAVRRGSKGIAVFGAPGTGKLRYYFDISDTESPTGERVHRWEVGGAGAYVAEALMRSYLPEDDTTVRLEEALERAADVLAEDRLERFLSHKSPEEVSGIMSAGIADALSSSVRYLAAVRCGSSANELALPGTEQLRGIAEADGLNILGCAVGELSADILRTAARAVAEKEAEVAKRRVAELAGAVQNDPKPDERSDDERGIQEGGRNDDSEPVTGAEPSDRSGSVRGEAAAVPEGREAGAVHGPSDSRRAGRAPGGDRQERERDDGSAGASHGEGPGNRRVIEAGGSRPMGAVHGRDPGNGGRRGDAGGDPGLAPAPEEPEEKPTHEEGARAEAPAPSAFSGVQQILDFSVPEATSEAATPVAEEAPAPDEPDGHASPVARNWRVGAEPTAARSPRERARANVDALRTLLAVEAESREATVEEQAKMAAYSGWGSLADAFSEGTPLWNDVGSELKQIASPEEYAAMRATTLDSFYTPASVARSIWSLLEKMGLEDGSVLEPSCGTGVFLGTCPENMRVSLTGIELDPLTARLASKLYPDARIRAVGFEKSGIAEGTFDAVVGNVPFGDYAVPDDTYGKGTLVHDYFFCRALDAVRPGGVVAMITSKGTLDKKNPKVRRHLACRADLVAAIRLPNDAFKRDAGVEVTTDIIVLQKLERPEEREPAWVHLGHTEDGVEVNGYFADHPEMILGRMAGGINVHGRPDGTACLPAEGAELRNLLSQAVGRIEARISARAAAPDASEVQEEVPESISADPEVRNYSFTERDGALYFRTGAAMDRCEVSKTAQSRIKGLIEVRDALRRVVDLQVADASDAALSQAQGELGRIYDSFTAKHGTISSRGNSLAFAQDSSYPLMCALEVLDEDGNFVAKADMFTKRTIRAYRPPESVDGPTEALALSLSEKGRVDVPFMARACRMGEDDVVRALGPAIFPDPSAGGGALSYLPADEYLSGDIRRKLLEAEGAASENPIFFSNVDALRAALPKDIPASEIDVRLGATWVPAEDVKEFMFELLQTPTWRQDSMEVSYQPYTAQWSVRGKSRTERGVLATSTYGTARASAYDIIEDTLNLRDVRVYDYVYDDDGRKKPVMNRRETAIALSKQEAIKAAFKDWVFDDPARRERLVRLYNDSFNSVRPRVFDGSHLTFPGMNPEIRLRDHQRNAVARIVYGGNTLLAHEVGAGKTFTMAAAAQELKRIGLCSKSLFVVPNHLIEQWASEYLRLYPAANLLVATKKDFEKKNRRRFCSRIATGDYDAVIIGHSQFEKIPISPERQRKVIEEEIADVTSGIEALKHQHGERVQIKQLESSRKKLRTRLERLAAEGKKDDVVTFGELGVDRLFVDEAHYYKNLFFATKMRNVGGIAQSEAQKSSDLYAKCRYLDEITGGKGVVFATGTPISNSMVELYTMQRYLQQPLLRHMGLQHFDAWASTFGETVTALELAPEGTGYRQKTRFSRFYNLPELMSLFKMVADVQTADMLKLPVPEVDFRNVALEPSEHQRAIVEGLGKRADKVRNGDVAPEADNMLKITNDGRKVALDQRLFDPQLPDHPQGKVRACAEKVFGIWEETAPERSSQLVFCDLSTPTGEGFNVYAELKRLLVEKGVPEEEVAFIHDFATDARKAALFSAVREGRVRVLVGSTAKMGAGTNVQTRLIALHDLDCPWRPSDLQQRLGRIQRQGNLNERVQVFRYVTEGTFDAYLYQLVEGKQRFVSQIMTDRAPVRSVADVDETALSYAELKALATGNPLIKERMDLEVEVSRLKLLKSNHLSQRYALEDRANKKLPQRESRLLARIEGLEADLSVAEGHPAPPKEAFAVNVAGVVAVTRAEAGDRLVKMCRNAGDSRPTTLGEYRGFALEGTYDAIRGAAIVNIRGSVGHRVDLGDDGAGNMTRIDNAIDRIDAELDEARSMLADVRAEIVSARSEAGKPFAHERELNEKSARLAQISAELDVGKTDAVPVDEARDEDCMRARPAREPDLSR